jgi:PAS domain-containing protein
MQTTNFRDQFTNIADACALAQAIVDTVREPVVVLDKGLRVVAASRSFYSRFKVRPEDTQGRRFLHAGRWTMGHPKTSRLAGTNHPRARRDGRL